MKGGCRIACVVSAAALVVAGCTPLLPPTGSEHRSTTTTTTSSTTTTSTSTTTTTTVPAPRVLFEDTFDGEKLDLSKWQPNWLAGNDTDITKPVNGNEVSCYDPAQVSVGGGYLRLRADKRECHANNGKAYEFASGLVNTRHDFTFTYGRVEARIFVPGSDKIENWPAFWANGTGTWPHTGEIDVFEGIQGDACYFFHSAGYDTGRCVTRPNPTGWHTYAAEWRPDGITYFCDGEPFATVTKGITSSPMYLILNLGISPTIAPPTVAPSEMLVDWVRVTE